MKHTRVLLAGALIATASSAAVASARPLVAHEAATPTVELRSTKAGMILTDSRGFTLFEFTKDKKGQDACVKINGCQEFWPPLLVSGTPTGGTGVNSALLGTTTISAGMTQVTYAGHPLYLYTGDKNPEETSYIGVKAFSGKWYALTAKGKAVKKPQGGSGGWARPARRAS